MKRERHFDLYKIRISVLMRNGSALDSSILLLAFFFFLVYIPLELQSLSYLIYETRRASYVSPLSGLICKHEIRKVNEKKKPNPKLQGENYYLEERNSWIAIHLEGATLSVYLWSLLISYDSILLDVVDVWKYYSFRYLWEGSRPMDFFASLSLS